MRFRLRQYALLAFLLPLTVAAQDEVLVAGNWVDPWGSNFGQANFIGTYATTPPITNSAGGQEFVATGSGSLTTLRASVTKRRDGQPLIVSFYRARDNRPGELLGELSVPSSAIQTYNQLGGAINTFDVREAGVTVEKGESYIVTFRIAPVGIHHYHARYTAPNPNAFGLRVLRSFDGGETWGTSHSTTEIGVRVYVAAPRQFTAAADLLSGDPANIAVLGKKNPKPLDMIVYGDRDFDATVVLTATASLADPEGAGGAVSPTWHKFDDVDGDGFVDLTFGFDLGEMERVGAIDMQTQRLQLAADLVGGDSVIAEDFVDVRYKGRGRKK